MISAKVLDIVFVLELEVLRGQVGLSENRSPLTATD